MPMHQNRHTAATARGIAMVRKSALPRDDYKASLQVTTAKRDSTIRNAKRFRLSSKPGFIGTSGVLYCQFELFALTDDFVLSRLIREQNFIDLIGLIRGRAVHDQFGLVVAECEHATNRNHRFEFIFLSVNHDVQQLIPLPVHARGTDVDVDGVLSWIRTSSGPAKRGEQQDRERDFLHRVPSFLQSESD